MRTRSSTCLLLPSGYRVVTDDNFTNARVTRSQQGLAKNHRITALGFLLTESLSHHSDILLCWVQDCPAGATERRSRIGPCGVGRSPSEE